MFPKGSLLLRTVYRAVHTDDWMFICCWGPNRKGKCLEENQRVFDATLMKYVPIKDFDPNNYVVTYINGDLVPVKPLAKVYQGIRPVYLVTTRTGRTIIATANHPFLTHVKSPVYASTLLKWKKLTDLAPGDSIGVPYKLPFFGDFTMDPNIVKLVAYLIGDGHVNENPQRVNFTNSDDKILDEFLKICDKLHFHTKVYHQNDYRDPTGLKDTRIIKMSSGKQGGPKHNNPVIDLFHKLGVKIAKSPEKEIPPFVFNLNREQLAMFLNRLFTADGSASLTTSLHKKTGQQKVFVISYSSASKRLIDQVSQLLLRFGIPTYRRCRRAGKGFSHELRISNSIWTKRFIENIGFYGDKEKVAEEAYPIISNYVARRDFYRGGATYRMGLLFDPIKSIIPLGSKPTWDLDIPITKNFVAEDIVAHNTTCAGNIAFSIYRDWDKVLQSIVFQIGQFFYKIKAGEPERWTPKGGFKPRVPLLIWDDMAVHMNKAVSQYQLSVDYFKGYFQAIATDLGCLIGTMLVPTGITLQLVEVYTHELYVETKGSYKFDTSRWIQSYRGWDVTSHKRWMESGDFKEWPRDVYKEYNEMRSALTHEMKIKIYDHMANEVPYIIKRLPQESIAILETLYARGPMDQSMIKRRFEDICGDYTVALANLKARDLIVSLRREKRYLFDLTELGLEVIHALQSQEAEAPPEPQPAQDKRLIHRIVKKR